jgi:hypothetical protein
LEKPPLQSKCFSRQNFLFQNTKEKFGGKNLLCKGSWSILIPQLPLLVPKG